MVKHFEIPIPLGVKTLLEMNDFFFKPKKWCQGALHKQDASCIMGALYRRNESSDDEKCMAIILLQAITNSSMLMKWNDEDSRTFKDVKNTIQKAIALAYERQEKGIVSTRKLQITPTKELA